MRIMYGKLVRFIYINVAAKREVKRQQEAKHFQSSI